MATPEEMAQSMIENMPEKTGKPLAEWLDMVRKSGLEKHGQIVKHLKGEHGMTHGFANLVAHKHLQALAPEEEDLVELQYAKKPNLRPLYDALAAEISSFGEAVELAPKKTYVSLRRAKQFGLLKPSTKTRLDVGLNLGDFETSERLEASGSFNSMVTHRVRVESLDEIDEELLGWLRAAYDRAD